MSKNSVIEDWEREAADIVRAVIDPRLRGLDARGLAAKLDVMPSTASGLLRTSRWTFTEAVVVAKALGFRVHVSVDE